MTIAAPGPRRIDERFTHLDPAVWTPAYLPAWSSRAEAAATWATGPDGLHLSLPPQHPRWCPDLHPEGTEIVEAATLAMERSGAARYDDVLVRSAGWAAVATSDLVRALVAALSDRTLHDPLTGLPGRELVLHTAREWARMIHGSDRRLLLVQTDVTGFGAVNARYGAAAADDLLRVLAGRLTAAVPEGSLVGRTGSDELMAVVMLRPAPAAESEAQVRALVAQVERAMLPRSADEPEMRVSAAASTPGHAEADLLVREAQHRMLARKGRAVPTQG